MPRRGVAERETTGGGGSTGRAQDAAGEQYTLTCDAGGRKARGTYVDDNGYVIPDANETANRHMPAVYEVYG